MFILAFFAKVAVTTAGEDNISWLLQRILRCCWFANTVFLRYVSCSISYFKLYNLAWSLLFFLIIMPGLLLLLDFYVFALVIDFAFPIR